MKTFLYKYFFHPIAQYFPRLHKHLYGRISHRTQYGRYVDTCFHSWVFADNKRHKKSVIKNMINQVKSRPFMETYDKDMKLIKIELK